MSTNPSPPHPYAVPVRASAVPVFRRRSDLCVVTLAAGPRGRECLAVSGPRLLDYARRVGADFRVMTPPDSPYPLGYKFALRQFLGVYERVVFLDADVVLEPDCPDLFRLVPETHVGMHDDRPHLQNGNYGHFAGEYAELNRLAGRPADPDPGVVWNTGVVVASAAHAEVFIPPAVPVPVGHTTEQSSITLNVTRLGIPVRPLPRELNWQWWADRDMRGPAGGGVKVWHWADCPHPERVAAMRTRAGTKPVLPLPTVPAVGRDGMECDLLGDPTGELRECKTCSGVRLSAVRLCRLHGACTADNKPVDGLPCCRTCRDKRVDPADDG